MKNKITYKEAGVDVEAGYKAVQLIKGHVRKTFNKNVISNLGGFAGLYALDKDRYEQPVLVSGTDGVGTKLKIAFLMDKHDTIGIDCVAMCVNDIVCAGAQPLFFLDYIASGKLNPEKTAEIVKGISEGCIQAGCALVGGETAEMPGFYAHGEYDMAGFSVGIVEKSSIITGGNINEGDVVLGLASSGVHSNGYSLVRKLFVEENNRLDEYNDELGCTIGEELLKPTKIYVRDVLKLISLFGTDIKGISHITGGGFIENIPRILPNGLTAVIKKGMWNTLPIFDIIQKEAQLEDVDMFNTFNMGIGMVVVVPDEKCSEIMVAMDMNNINVSKIGEIKKGDTGVEICP